MMGILRPALIFAALLQMAQMLPCTGQEIDDRGAFLRMKESMVPVLPESDTVSLVFIGDVMLHERQITVARERYLARHGGNPGSVHDGYDFSSYFLDLEDRLASADLAVANMEFTLAGPPFSGYPAFSAPDSYAEYMSDCGIDVFLTANNHILDKGGKGALRTLSVYEKMMEKKGIRFTGTSADSAGFTRDNPLVLDVNGMKVALVNFTYGTNIHIQDSYPKVNRISREALSVLMGKARESGADLIIALPHWGEEYSMRHSAAQEDLAEWLADNGADLVIGTHPHVVQDSTVIRTCTAGGREKDIHVIYSLGNSVSNMSAGVTQIGLLSRVTAVKHLNGKVDLAVGLEYLWCSLPGRLKDTHCTIPVKEYLDRRGEWKMPYEYDKMVKTYYTVKEKTGVKD